MQTIKDIQQKKSFGFTLIELIVTLVVAALILAIGVPSFLALIQNNRLTTSTNELVGSLNLARSEAIKRGIRVTACKSSDGASCSNAGNWAQGWIVFTDNDNNAAYNNASETLLRVHEAVGGQITMTGNNNVANYISYVASGQSQVTGGGFQAGTLRICDSRNGNVGKNLVLSNTGRITIDSNVVCP